MSTHSGKQAKTKRNRKRPAKEGTLEKAMEVMVSKIMKLQDDSDSKMLEMEKKVGIG